jgi:hypothetical protein
MLLIGLRTSMLMVGRANSERSPPKTSRTSITILVIPTSLFIIAILALRGANMTKRSLLSSSSVTSLSRTPATHALTRADPRGFSTMHGALAGGGTLPDVLTSRALLTPALMFPLIRSG